MLPEHIGIIIDGNRRFAKQLMKKPWEGHKFGLTKTREVLTWACEKGIKYMTAYVLSLENLTSRPKRELQMILRYFDSELENIIENKDHVIHSFNVQTKFIGRKHLLPDYMQKKMKKIEQITKKYTQHILNVAVAYGGQQELVDATQKILKKCLKGIIKPADLNVDVIKNHLYTGGQPAPDLIFRTGGEKRLSNFLPFQSVYSELIFTDKKWPEITKKDFQAALDEFDSRKRRFGS
ncbi:MAG: polyprenyl diphosphate synthase [Candidatus Aenigmarchaeota archaeon]|nr:polyprenyl diphosphate synthase [Candidatus Aenigmarchaeota archaeon]